MTSHTVWLGPPGSGKTTLLLKALRPRLREFGEDFRLIVPTATMAEHLRNRLAREGLVVRTGTILTVNAHARELAGEPGLVTAAALEMHLVDILARDCPEEFLPLRDLPGFVPLLATTLDELANAGCDPLLWAGFLSLEPGSRSIVQAIADVWSELDTRLREARLLTRRQWLQRAAQALRDGVAPHVADFYWDGFSRLAAGELSLIRAQIERGGVTVTLPAWYGATRGGLVALRRAGFAIRRFSPVRATPRKILVIPASAEDEAAEIARRILEQHRAGRPWHEIGVVVRAHEPYVPLLESTFARFGIPARSYFRTPATAHPVARLFGSALEALLGGWPWEPLLEAMLSPAGLAGACPASAGFEYDMREALPGSCLARPRELAARRGAEALLAFLDLLAGFESWRDLNLPPAVWPARLEALNRLLEPPRSDEGFDAEKIGVWRTRAAAAGAWLGAVSEAAALLPPEPVSLKTLLDRAQPFLRHATMPGPEFWRDAVHLLDAQEARQWELPVVFVCGLLEGVFPGVASPDPLLGEALRSALRRRGIAVRSRLDRDYEERFLFEVAKTRATELLVLSYPRLNEEGQKTLGAFALDRIEGLEAEEPVACDLAAPCAAPAEAKPGAVDEGPGSAAAAALSPDAAARLARIHDHFSPTGLETYLECPFRFFAEHTLKTEPPPPKPGERFDGLARGSLVHHVLKQYHRLGGDLLALFEREWERTMKLLHVPESYRLELERARIRRSLRMYAADPPTTGWEQHTEEPFEITVGDVLVKGRIDRYETSPEGECVVYDYKFSRPSVVATTARRESGGKNGEETKKRGLQAGMYLLAVQGMGLKPKGFYYIAVKDACATKGWDDPAVLDSLAASAGARGARAAAEILAGRIAVAPVAGDACDRCDFKLACRIREIRSNRHEDDEVAAAAAGE